MGGPPIYIVLRMAAVSLDSDMSQYNGLGCIRSMILVLADASGDLDAQKARPETVIGPATENGGQRRAQTRFGDV